MKFPWSKPSAYEVVESLFNEFTPEERKVLDGENCVMPRMYARLLKEAEVSRSKYSLEDAKRRMKILFFPLGDRINDPIVQRDIFLFFISDLLYCQ